MNTAIPAFGSIYSHGGIRAAYCAGFGYRDAGGLLEPIKPRYRHDMRAYMRRNVDLRSFTSANLAFWNSIPGIETCCDSLQVYVGTNLVWRSSSPHDAWQSVNVDLTPYLGGIQTLSFEFWSDSSADAEGAYLDDISVTGMRVLPDRFETETEIPPVLANRPGLGYVYEPNMSLHLPDDIDFFEINLSGRATSEHFIRIAFDSNASDLDLFLYNEDRNLLATSDGVSDLEEIRLNNLAPGRYYIGVASFDDRVIPYYQLMVLAPLVDANGDYLEPNNHLESPSQLGALSGRRSWPALSIHATNDYDVLRFSLGQTGGRGDYLSIQFAHESGDLDLLLFNAQGQLVSYSRGSGNEETIPLLGFPSGEYSAVIFGYDRALNPDYSLVIQAPGPTVIPADAYEANNSRSAVAALPAGAVFQADGTGQNLLSANLGPLISAQQLRGLTLHQAGDHDWFAFSLADEALPGNAVSILHDYRRGDLDAEIVDEGGNVLRSAAGLREVEILRLDGLPAGTYFLHVYGGKAGVTSPAYEIHFQPPGTDGNDSIGTSTPLGLVSGLRTFSGFGITGGGDEDWFRFRIPSTGLASHSVRVLFSHAHGDLDVELQGEVGDVRLSEGATDEESVSLEGLPAGVDLYLRVYGYAGEANPRYTLVFDAPTGIGGDPFDREAANDTPASASDLNGLFQGAGDSLSLHDAEDPLSIHAGDIDFYRFHLPAPGAAGHQISIQFDHAQGDIDLALLAEGNPVPLDISEGVANVHRISLQGLPAGDYLVRVTGYGQATSPGYALSILRPAGAAGGDRFESPPNNTLLRATSLGSVSGITTLEGLSLHEGDEADWFSFSLSSTAGRAHYLRLDFVHAEGDLDLELLDASGISLAVSQGISDSEYISLEGLGPGDYFCRIYGYRSARNPRYTLTVSAPEGQAGDWAEPNDAWTSPRSLKNVEGLQTWDPLSLHSSTDEDWFRFSTTGPASARHAVKIVFDPLLGDLDLLVCRALNTNLFAVSETAQGLESVDLLALGDGGAAGDYLIRVRRHGDGGLIPYQLVLHAPDAGNADAHEPNNHSGQVAELHAVEGIRTFSDLSLHAAGDEDWFSFHTVGAAVEGHGVAIAFDHSAGDLSLQVVTPAGAVLTSANAGDREWISLAGQPAASAAAPFLVRVHGAATGVTSPRYTLTVHAPREPRRDWAEPNDTASSPTDLREIRDGLVVENLSIHEQDEDWFIFRFEEAPPAGSRVRLDFNPSEGDLSLAVTDPLGAVLSSNRTGADEEILLGGRAAGLYRIHVRGSGGALNPSYVLTVQGPPDLAQDYLEANNTPDQAVELRGIDLGPDSRGRLSLRRLAVLLLAAYAGQSAQSSYSSAPTGGYANYFAPPSAYGYSGLGFTTPALDLSSGPFSSLTVPPQFPNTLSGLTATPYAPLGLGTVPVYDTFANSSGSLGPLGINFGASPVGNGINSTGFMTGIPSIGGGNVSGLGSSLQNRFNLAMIGSAGNMASNLSTANRLYNVVGSTPIIDPSYFSPTGLLGLGSIPGLTPYGVRSGLDDIRTLPNLSIHTPGEEDWFRIDLGSTGTPDQYVALAFDPALGDLRLDLYEAFPSSVPAGQRDPYRIDSSNSSGGGEQISLGGLAAGAYLARVSGATATSVHPNYTLQVSATPVPDPAGDFAEPNDSAGQAHDLRTVEGASAWPGLSVHTRADVDWFRFRLAGPGQPGHHARIDFKHAEGDLDLALFGSASAPAPLLVSEGTTGREELDLAGLPAGEYWLRITGHAGAISPRYALILNCPVATLRPDRLEPNNQAGQATDLDAFPRLASLPALNLHPASASAPGDDVDVFQFTIPAGVIGTENHFLALNYEEGGGELDLVVRRAGETAILASTGGLQRRLSLAGLTGGSYRVTVQGRAPGTVKAYDLYLNLPHPDLENASASAENDWTLLVYITASDLQEAAFKNINEMELAATRLPGTVQFAVLWDQSQQGANYPTGGGAQPAWGATGRALIQPDTRADVVATPFHLLPEQNTGSAAALTEFLAWASAAAPARNYALVLWNHGGGDLYGSNFDNEGIGAEDALRTGELRSALEAAPASLKANLKVIAFDACLMAMAEVVHGVRGLAEVFVGSEESESTTGFDYTTAFAVLENQPERVTAEDLGSSLVRSYQSQYQGNRHAFDTLSALRLRGGAPEALAAALRNFSLAAEAAPTPDNVPLADARGQAAFFYGSADYRDLGQYMRAVAGGTAGAPLRATAASVLEALESMVVARSTDQRNTSGLSIYLPPFFDPSGATDGDYRARNTDFLAASAWDRFLLRLAGQADAGTIAADWSEANDMAARAFPLRVVRGSPAFDALSLHTSSDQDWFRFSLEAPAVAGHFMRAVSTQGVARVEVFNLSQDLRRVSLGSTSGGTALSLEGLVAGEYWTRVSSADGQPVASYRLEFQVPSAAGLLTDADPGNTRPDKAHDLGVIHGESVHAGWVVNTGEEDWFRFALPRIRLDSPARVRVDFTGTLPLRAQLYSEDSGPASPALVDASGGAPLWLDIPSAAGGRFLLKCRMDGGVGSISYNLHFVTGTPADRPLPPAFATHPRPLKIRAGTPANWTTSVLRAPSSFQWRFNGRDVASATNQNFAIPAVTPADAGSYDLVARNPSGAVASRPATLLVVTNVYENVRGGGGTPQPVFSGVEYGDDVVLEPVPFRVVTDFRLPYSATALTAAPGKQLVIRFYALQPGNLPSPPGELLFASAPIPLVSLQDGGTHVASLTNLFVHVPGAWAWSAEFQGLSSGDAVQIWNSGPPVRGLSSASFWRRSPAAGGTWVREGLPAGFSGAGSFAAEILAASTPLPRLGGLRVVNGVVQVDVVGDAGLGYRVGRTSDIPGGAWFDGYTITNTTGEVRFHLPVNPFSPAEAVRAVLIPPEF